MTAPAPSTVELIGWVAPRVSSEIIPPVGPAFDRDVLAHTARIHEAAGFDRVLVGYFSDAPDGFLVAAHVAATTERLGALLAHRPGFVAPTLAARKLATLDQLSGGRLAVHIIAGGSDEDQARDGDFIDHDARYRRAAEYVDILRRSWTEPVPFDHDGEFYRLRRSHADIRPVRSEGIPVYGGGGSPSAIEQLAPRLDTFMLWGEPLADASAFIQQVRTAAAAGGRPDPGISVSTRPILGRTEDEAWARAHRILDQIQERAGRRPGRRASPQNEGSRRLLDAAARGEVHDRCLWTPLAAATGAPGNSTALVGTAETVAQALADYVDIGATTLLIRGYDPLPDAEQYGRELVPRVRELVAARAGAVA